jgi:glutamate/tyrosine decarboxylase-like PLP-dependent enzyme
VSDFDLSPDELRRLGRLAVEAVAAHRAELDRHPVFGKVGLRAALFDEPLPEEGRPFEEVLAFARAHVLPAPFGNSHPRFFAFINASADPVGIFADLMAHAMNPNCWGGDHAAIHVEHRALSWLAAILGLPPESEGILTSGGSMANFTALAAARAAMAPWNVREEGAGVPGQPRLVVYASDQVHNCVDKAVDLLGLGWKQLRKIPSDEGFRLRVDLLRAQIARDRAAGLLPAIVVGSAGTVNTGAVDPLDEIAELCETEGLWFHADGAYGAMAVLADELRPLFRGLERARSVAADPHKWLYVPYEAGAAFVREPGRLGAAFRRPAEYLVQDAESPLLGPPGFNDRGPELSRAFKALKVWMGLKVHGRRAYAERVRRDCALAAFLAGELDRRPGFERLAPVGLSIVNFRCRPEGLPEDRLDALNRQVVNRLVAGGGFMLAPTVLRGRVSMRVCIVNFRTRETDLLALLDEAGRCATEIASGR